MLLGIPTIPYQFHKVQGQNVCSLHISILKKKVKNRIFIVTVFTVAVYTLLHPFPNKPRFSRVCSRSLLKTLWEKEKLLVTSNFSFPPSFLPIWMAFYRFHQIQNCHLQTLSVWKSRKTVVWERVKNSQYLVSSNHPKSLTLCPAPVFTVSQMKNFIILFKTSV